MDASIDRKKSGEFKAYPKISLTGNFIIYMMIFIAALIFTQALRSKASNIFFGFIFFLPLVMLLYTITAKSALKIYLLSESTTLQKHDPYSYRLRIINESILPYPFIDAIMLLPQANSVRCIERSVRIAMSPLASYTVKNTVSFRFRGTYEIGVECIYIYDFFRMVRVRVDINLFDTISVLPRRLFMKPGDTNAVSDSARETKKDPNSYEKIEISDIREYKSGDSLKSIHWKISSKSEEFMVRDYDTGSSKKTFIFCDLSARFPSQPPDKATTEEQINKKSNKNVKTSSENAGKNDSHVNTEKVKTYTFENGIEREVADNDVNIRTDDQSAAYEQSKKKKTAKAVHKNMIQIDGITTDKKVLVDVHELADDKFYDDMNEYCADGVVELTVAAVLRELRDNNECTLFWFDRRSEAGLYSFTFRGMEDFNAVYKLFATAPLCPAEDNVTRLQGMVSDTQDVKLLYVTSAIDADAVREFGSIQSVSDGAAFGASGIILYNPEERFAHVSERKLYIEGCRAQLASKGLKLSESRIDGV